MEVLARNYVTGVFEQKSKYLEGLVLKFQADAVFVQLARTQVDFEGAEARLAGS
jgi:hypothetical protein